MAEYECLELIRVHSTFLQNIRHLFLNSKSRDPLTDDFNHMWSEILPVCSAAKIEDYLSTGRMLYVKCDRRKIEPIWRETQLNLASKPICRKLTVTFDIRFYKSYGSRYNVTSTVDGE